MPYPDIDRPCSRPDKRRNKCRCWPNRFRLADTDSDCKPASKSRIRILTEIQVYWITFDQWWRWLEEKTHHLWSKREIFLSTAAFAHQITTDGGSKQWAWLMKPPTDVSTCHKFCNFSSFFFQLRVCPLDPIWLVRFKILKNSIGFDWFRLIDEIWLLWQRSIRVIIWGRFIIYPSNGREEGPQLENPIKNCQGIRASERVRVIGSAEGDSGPSHLMAHLSCGRK